MLIFIAAGVMWFGYQNLVYGFSQIRGQNFGYADLAWPGRSLTAGADGDTNPAQPKSSSTGAKPGQPIQNAVKAKCNPLSPSDWLTPGGPCSPFGLITGK